MKALNPRKKILFLFAGYNPQNVIDAALVYYVRALSKFGDVALVMDCDCPDTELNKLSHITLYASGIRHGEYDFGSYRRAYEWATKNLDLSEYDFMYLVNDSVYGPLYDMTRYFSAMEHMGHDAFGMVKNPHHDHPHIQSWFIGLTPTVFLSDWFDKFMRRITKQKSKGAITKLYEQGLTKLISEHGITWDCLYCVPGRGVYNKISKLYKSGMPFMKRIAFTRNHGALGTQIQYVLDSIEPSCSDAILSSVKQLHGDRYISWLLTRNPIKILTRKIHHALRKIFIEGL